MNTKKRITELERRNAQRQEQVVLTIVYSDGTRGQSYVLTGDGIRPAAEGEVDKWPTCHAY